MVLNFRGKTFLSPVLTQVEARGSVPTGKSLKNGSRNTMFVSGFSRVRSEPARTKHNLTPDKSAVFLPEVTGTGLRNPSRQYLSKEGLSMKSACFSILRKTLTASIQRTFEKLLDVLFYSPNIRLFCITYSLNKIRIKMNILRQWR